MEPGLRIFVFLKLLNISGLRDPHRSNTGPIPDQYRSSTLVTGAPYGAIPIAAPSRNRLPGCRGSPMMLGAMAVPSSIVNIRPAPPASLRPTRARYWVIVFAVALAIIQYIDRVCISQAAPLISRDLSLNKEQMGWVFSAFTLAYALFEIPAGYLGDRIGPRKVLLRIVLWWSFFTAAMGWTWNCASLLVTRFLFGAGEAGAFPNLTKAFHRWLPLHERTRAQGVMWMSEIGRAHV